MRTLFIDTSMADVSIVILDNNKVLNVINKSIPNEHSIYVVPFIDEILKKSNLKPNDIDRIMVCAGPGSFTGTRIGLTVAKVYGYALKKDVILISSLKALALSSDSKITISLINARNNNYYFAIYDENYNELECEQFITKNEILEKISKYSDYKLVSYEEEKIDDFNVIKVPFNYEKIENYYDKEKPTNIHKIKPNYLKLPSAMEK